MHALIFLGGEFAALRRPLPEADTVIAADRGWDNAVKNGVTPDILVGDMDSIDRLPRAAEIIRVPAIKDETDAQLALRIAADRGADRITLAGRLSGRADHTLSVIFMLEALKKENIACEIIDDVNRVRLLENESVFVMGEYKYFGLLSLGTSTVSVSSCRYPLENAVLRRDDPYAVSNEAEGDGARITVSGDPVILVESD